MSQGETVVRTTGLRKEYAGTIALHGLDLELYAGEVFGFLGPNGAGKTTTVKLLLGLVRPTAGEVELFGERLAGNERSLLPRIGAMVEAPAFYPYLSAADNLRLLAKLGRVGEARVAECIEIVGLKGAERHRFSHYSVGMKQRLAIAAALLRDPRLIILDEPTSGLDPQGQRGIDEVIRRLGDEGRTVFLSSHSMPEVERVCDRVAFMRAGQKVFEGRVSELVKAGERVALRVREVERAREVIGALPWVGGVSTDGDCLVVEAPAARSSELAAALAGAGIDLSELRPMERTMETLYHEVMSLEEAA